LSSQSGGALHPPTLPDKASLDFIRSATHLGGPDPVGTSNWLDVFQGADLEKRTCSNSDRQGLHSGRRDEAQALRARAHRRTDLTYVAAWVSAAGGASGSELTASARHSGDAGVPRVVDEYLSIDTIDAKAIAQARRRGPRWT
jgi:hypothetical protein